MRIDNTRLAYQKITHNGKVYTQDRIVSSIHDDAESMDFWYLNDDGKETRVVIPRHSGVQIEMELCTKIHGDWIPVFTDHITQEASS